MSDAVQQDASWATVAPLVQRWQMALVPRSDGTWDVLACFPDAGPPVHEVERVPFAGLPQAIQDLAARCAAEEGRTP